VNKLFLSELQTRVTETSRDLADLQADLVLVELVVDQLVLALLLERDDDQRDEDVDEEEREDDEVDDVEDGHVEAEARLGAAVLVRGVDRVLQHSVCNTTVDIRSVVRVDQIEMLAYSLVWYRCLPDELS